MYKETLVEKYVIIDIIDIAKLKYFSKNIF
ncbi:hypothetical protein CNEO4_350133 [Clostridium neonatale]|nr:hypothetical protein CNEO4_350133 [Clostridium neonatale]CAI3657647.1 hypothetical protein CNEO4_440014 [Clostridium neonatale]CAI3690616.1 hypothetical protein CNEO4_750053 [Clostridium neonatale]